MHGSVPDANLLGRHQTAEDTLPRVCSPSDSFPRPDPTAGNDQRSDPVDALDREMMARCLALAEAAAQADEVPVGALILRTGVVLGEAANRTRASGSPLAHAEMLALEQAFTATGEARLPGATLYCTLEPCFMCAGALVHARVDRLVFATRDPKFGACGSLADLPHDRRLNHRLEVTEGVGREDSAALLRAFFRAKR